ncbi:MAG TPA: kelch repeat-containing protein, partial [Polyangia bacterium]
FGASATLLGDGRVLLAGGATRGSPGAPDPSSITALVDLYDPAAGTFTVFHADGLSERIYHAAGPTPDGGVLFAGGLGKFGPLDDVYKIDAQHAGPVGKLPAPRWAAAAATLADGTLLLVGGYTSSDGMGGGMLAPDALVVAPDGSATAIVLPTPRAFAVATRLGDGSVLVSGGRDDAGVRADALVFSPATRSFAPLSPSAGARATMLSPRIGHTATLLPSGALFLFGGNDGRASVAAAELWSPDAGGFVDPPVFNLAPRQRAAAATLADGTVVLAGGESSPQPMSIPSPVLDAILFHPSPTGAAGTLGDDAGATPARAEATATTLGDGSVLYVGGGVGDPRTLAGGAELFVPCFGACLAVTP